MTFILAFNTREAVDIHKAIMRIKDHHIKKKIVFCFSTNYYKVHFTEALELVRSRRVFLENGIAFVPESEMKTLLTSVFKNLLSRNLALTCKTLPNLVSCKL